MGCAEVFIGLFEVEQVRLLMFYMLRKTYVYSYIMGIYFDYYNFFSTG